MNKNVMICSEPNALDEFLKKLIRWEQEYIYYLKQNIKMKPINAREEKIRKRKQLLFMSECVSKRGRSSWVQS